MNWIKDNWDKVLAVLISAVVAGIVGYFTGVIAVRSDLTNLSERIAVIETQVNQNVRPKMSIIDKQGNMIYKLKQELDEIKKLNDIASQTNKLFDQEIKTQRRETLRELAKILGCKTNR